MPQPASGTAPVREAPMLSGHDRPAEKLAVLFASRKGNVQDYAEMLDSLTAVCPDLRTGAEAADRLLHLYGTVRNGHFADMDSFLGAGAHVARIASGLAAYRGTADVDCLWIAEQFAKRRASGISRHGAMRGVAAAAASAAGQ